MLAEVNRLGRLPTLKLLPIGEPATFPVKRESRRRTRSVDTLIGGPRVTERTRTSTRWPTSNCEVSVAPSNADCSPDGTGSPLLSTRKLAPEANVTVIGNPISRPVTARSSSPIAILNCVGLSIEKMMPSTSSSTSSSSSSIFFARNTPAGSVVIRRRSTSTTWPFWTQVKLLAAQPSKSSNSVVVSTLTVRVPRAVTRLNWLFIASLLDTTPSTSSISSSSPVPCGAEICVTVTPPAARKLTPSALSSRLFRFTSTSSPVGEFPVSISGNGGFEEIVTVPAALGLISHPASVAPVSFLKVNSGFANVMAMSLYVSTGTLTVLRNAASVSRRLTSIWTGAETSETSGWPVFECSTAPVIVTSNVSTVTFAGGVSVIERLRGAVPAPPPEVIFVLPPLQPASTATTSREKNAKARNTFTTHPPTGQNWLGVQSDASRGKKVAKPC